MSFDPRSGEHFRIEQRVVAPEGESSTVIRKNGSVTVDYTDVERKVRRFHATLAPGVYERLVEELHNAGFPTPPAGNVTPGPTRVVSAIRNGKEHRTRPVSFHQTAPHWREAFALLDAITAQTSKGIAETLDPKAEPAVTNAAELNLFQLSDKMDPPLGQDANEIVATAFKLAVDHHHAEITAAHLLTAFVREHGYQLARLGLDPERIKTSAEALFSWDKNTEPVEPSVSPAFELIQEVARRMAAEEGTHEATLRHFVRALLQAGGADVTRILQKNRLPDAILGGRTKERIFADPGPQVDKHCTRCGAPTAQQRWCPRCGLSLTTPASFATGTALDRVRAVVEPYEWPLRSSAVHRSLCSLPDVAGTPWLRFGLAALEGDMELVTPAKMTELDLSLERLEQAALANLAHEPVSWIPRWAQGVHGREVDVLFCIDQAYAAERILDKPFLLHAQGMLGTNVLAASVPQRNVLLVTRLEDLAALMALARQYFDSAGDKHISAWGFIVLDGAISGPISSG
jgi:hypothetical protein